MFVRVLQYDRDVQGNSEINQCQCDMVKRLDCFVREGQADLQCGQFKQLVKTHRLDNRKTEDDLEECSPICARLLAGL